MVVQHRPGAKKGGVATSIGNEVKQHPIATAGVAILAGLAIWALVQNKQGTDSTATPSDSFWQGYSTAQEDYLQTLSRAYYASGSNQASQPAQTPGSVDPGVSPAVGASDSTNSVFTPAYTTDITPSGMPSAQNPMLPVRTGTKLARHHAPAARPATHPARTGRTATPNPSAARSPAPSSASIRQGLAAEKAGRTRVTIPRRVAQTPGNQPLKKGPSSRAWWQ